jgi:hypothetical protein
VVALVLVVGFVAVTLIQTLPDPAPSGPGVVAVGPSTTRAGSARPSAASAPPQTPTARPTAKPKAERPVPNRSLTRNSLYSVELDRARVRCAITVRSPKPPLRNDNLAPYLRTLLKCMVKAVVKPVAGAGFSLTAPKVKVYRKSIKSPCGRFDQNGAPAYYCSANQTIYWPATRDDGSEAYTFARLGYVGLAAHEFGHHLQAASGLTAGYARRYYAADQKAARYRLSRRLELQAQCFEGVFLGAAARSLDLSDADRQQLRSWHGYTGDEDPPSSRKPDHGSSAAQIFWLNRGLDSADFGRCNTWKASKASVK